MNCFLIISTFYLKENFFANAHIEEVKLLMFFVHFYDLYLFLNAVKRVHP